MCGRGREHIAAVEGCADVFPKETFVCQLTRLVLPFPLSNPTEQPIIRPDKKLIGTLDQDRPALRANAWIDYAHVNCSSWKISVNGKKVKSARVDVVRRDVVRGVDNLRARVDREDHTLHRTDEIILYAEIGEESDDRIIEIRHR